MVQGVGALGKAVLPVAVVYHFKVLPGDGIAVSGKAVDL